MRIFENIYYQSQINQLGGTTTTAINFAKKYSNYDCAIVYKRGDPKRVAEIAKYMPVIRYTGQKIKCGKLFVNYDMSICDKIEADEYIRVVHVDYRFNNVVNKNDMTHPKVTKYIAVGVESAKGFTELTGIPCEVCYNVIDVPKPTKRLKLISTTRLGAEKGKDRMLKLCKMLDKAKIPFEWDIYTKLPCSFDHPAIRLHNPINNVIDKVVDADYLVQLSDSEGYCNSVVEALACQVPVIVTPVPSILEIGVKEGENGYVVPFDMDFDVAKLKKIPKVEKMTFPKDRYKEYLNNKKWKYDADEKCIKVRAKQPFKDVEENKKRAKGDEWFVSYLRYSQLADFVEEVEK